MRNEEYCVELIVFFVSVQCLFLRVKWQQRCVGGSDDVSACRPVSGCSQVCGGGIVGWPGAARTNATGSGAQTRAGKREPQYILLYL